MFEKIEYLLFIIYYCKMMRLAAGIRVKFSMKLESFLKSRNIEVYIPSEEELAEQRQYETELAVYNYIWRDYPQSPNYDEEIDRALEQMASDFGESGDAALDDMEDMMAEEETECETTEVLTDSDDDVLPEIDFTEEINLNDMFEE